MRQISIDDGLKISFPGREASFNDGVEIGVLAALMALGHSEIIREVAPQTVEQATILAAKLGYYVTTADHDADVVLLVLSDRPPRPKLRIVSSR